MSNAIIIEPLALSALFAPSAPAVPTALADLRSDLMGVRYVSGAAGATDSIDIDLAAATAIDTVALLATNGAPATWAVAAADTQGGLATPAYTSGSMTFPAGTVTPTTGDTHALHAMSAAETRRWWRLSLAGLSVPVAAGRLVMGRRIALARNFSTGAAFGVRDLGAVDFSPLGVPIVRPGARQRQLGLRFAYTYRDEAEALVSTMMERVGNTLPILIVTDPAVNAQRQRRMYFGYLQGQLDLVVNTGNMFEWRVTMASLI
ncbi:hypothetical protein [Sandarakinorhabdus sp.]|uniref:hypothetical protein n=1 Tax=Sandarakinorhabdus sp. TaxID=1916663 RepID=UPI00286D90D1|nr:hypothetical protein [Sandarakinorhabdus sp.]